MTDAPGITFVPEKKNQRYRPRKPRKTEVRVSGPEIQALAVDTRTAVCVSTAEKVVLGGTQKLSGKFGVAEG